MCATLRPGRSPLLVRGSLLLVARALCPVCSRSLLIQSLQEARRNASFRWKKLQELQVLRIPLDLVEHHTAEGPQRNLHVLSGRRDASPHHGIDDLGQPPRLVLCPALQGVPSRVLDTIPETRGPNVLQERRGQLFLTKQVRSDGVRALTAVLFRLPTRPCRPRSRDVGDAPARASPIKEAKPGASRQASHARHSRRQAGRCRRLHIRVCLALYPLQLLRQRFNLTREDSQRFNLVGKSHDQPTQIIVSAPRGRSSGSNSSSSETRTTSIINDPPPGRGPCLHRRKTPHELPDEDQAN